MKKYLILILLGLCLCACVGREKPDKNIILNNIIISDLDDVRDDFKLPGIKGIKWTSSDSAVIEINGDTAIVKKVNEDRIVILSAVLNDVQRDFVFTVRADSDNTEAYRDYVSLKNNLGHILNNNQLLPNVGENGSEITYEVKSGDIEIKDGQVIKLTDEEKSEVEIRIIITNGDCREEKINRYVVLDEYEAYIMAYFNGDLGEERGHLAYSRDGLNWIYLKNSVIEAKIGSGRIRDPFISRNRDGNFVVLATEGYDNPSIYYWESEDLTEFKNNHLIQEAEEIREIKLTGHRAWAPEFSYNPDDDLYYVYFSDPKGEEADRMYFVTTEDFSVASRPKTLINVGKPCIDSTIKNIDGKQYMFFKGENDDDRQIYYVSSNNLNELFTIDDMQKVEGPVNVEGPFIVKRNDGEGYYLYVDSYKEGKFYVASFNKLDNKNDIVWLEEDTYKLSDTDVRHGSVVSVTLKELERIISFYN